ncbi:hypothetical protein CKO44_02215 [Rubrivivax gelatinosus]|nr:hypothetical protein [Rubrivivax gelatinosus]MBZ8143281.1 hypothetical protein [Rubrivivax gelatinosus]
MMTSKSHLAAALVLVLAAAPAAAQVAAKPAIPPKYKASPMEVAYLPKYCYHQYVDGALQPPVFAISPDSCGTSMNHFCPALVFLRQASSPTLAMNERRGAAQSAVREVDYTIREMKPGCYVTKDVMDAKARAAALAKVLVR